MPNNLTDNEIIKALERLKNTKDYLKEQYREQVKKCPYAELKPIAKQTYDDNKKAFDIAIKAIEEFNRLQVENERLKSDVSVSRDAYMSMKDRYEYEKEKVEKAKQKCIGIAKALKTAKAEAYKEFAERLKEEQEFFVNECDDFVGYVAVSRIDNLLKEMVGDNQ